jgi:hypothetical protein
LPREQKLSKQFHSPKYFDVLQARRAYGEGKNITEMLRAQKGLAVDEPEIIEIAYDLQAGTYIEFASKNREFSLKYARELADIIQNYMTAGDTLLDVGTGEITTLSLVCQCLTRKPLRIYAFDISWSRIFKGVHYANDNMGECFGSLVPFVADISETPLLDKSVNVTISSHALEPNGSRLSTLLLELFRVTKDRLILFEPCYEMSTDEGRQRMDRLGYIRGLDSVATALGGKLVDRIKIENVSNPLNPTACFIIEPPLRMVTEESETSRPEVFSLPGSNLPLDRIDNFLFSKETGLCFPILKSVPILKSNAAILASALGDEGP